MQYGSDTGQGHAFSGGPVAVGDANFELDYNGGSQPLLRFDSGDYLQFTRTNNTLSFNVGGTSLTMIDGSGNLSSTGAIFPGGDANYLLGVFSSNPRIQFDANDTIAYDRANNIYNFNIAGSTVLGIASGAAALGSGVQLLLGDSNYYVALNSGTPVVNFDSGGDAYLYDRTSNSHKWLIGGTNELTLNTTGLFVSNLLTAATLSIDANFSLQITSGNPQVTFDTNDTIAYDRTGNVYNFNIAGSTRLSLANSVLTMAGDVLATGDVVAGNDTNFRLKLASGNPQLILDSGDALVFNRTTNTHSLTLANSTQLSVNAAGTFVANVLTVGDGNFGMSLNGGSQPLVLYDTGDYASFVRSSNTYTWVIGNTQRASLDSSGTFVATSIVPGDANYFLSMSGSNPQIVFDTGGDRITYDRTANKFYFVIGGVNVASIDASGNMRLKGTLTQSVTP